MFVAKVRCLQSSRQGALGSVQCAPTREEVGGGGGGGEGGGRGRRESGTDRF